MSLQRLFTVASLVLLAGCASVQSSSQTVTPTPGNLASPWLADVAAMTEASDNSRRREAIQRRLDELGITWRTASFTIERQHGTNLLANLDGPDSAPLLMLGAHFDRVDVGVGATDNASGSATVLALAQRLKARPLANHRVAISFWDLEERGLLGSKAYIANGGAKPALYVNFDVFGWGDTLWLMTPDATHPLIAASQSATRSAGIGLSAGPQYPPTDHLAFLKAKWPAVSYSLVGADEIPRILEVFAGKKPAQVPKVMQVIHSDHDTIEQVDVVAVASGIDAVEAALRQWDAGTAASAATQ